MLRSAAFVVGAGGGFGLAGWALLDATPAAAQPLVAAPSQPTPPVAGPASSHAGPTKTPTRTQHTKASSAHAKHGVVAAAAPARAANSGSAATPAVAGASTTPVAKPAHSAGPKPKPAPMSKPAPKPKPDNQPAGGTHGAAGKKAGGQPAKPGPSSAPQNGTAAAGSLASRSGSFVFPLLPFAPVAELPFSDRPAPFAVSIPVGNLAQAERGLSRLPFSLTPGSWTGPSLKVVKKLKVPLAVLAAIGLFMLAQALVDRRDPKVSDAPERSWDDTIGFE